MTKPKYLGGLGFRDIELFNLALLARQSWRVVQEPTSLRARVLKAVYFPDTEFLEAELGSSPSRVRRAVVDGRDVLKQGLIHRIGTGEATTIWDMNWLPRDHLLRPVASISDDNPPLVVSELIDESLKKWDLQLLQMHFIPMDQEVIVNITLSFRRQHRED